MSNSDLPIAWTPIAGRARGGGRSAAHRRPFEISFSHVLVTFKAVTSAELERILDP